MICERRVGSTDFKWKRLGRSGLPHHSLWLNSLSITWAMYYVVITTPRCNPVRFVSKTLIYVLSDSDIILSGFSVCLSLNSLSNFLPTSKLKTVNVRVNKEEAFELKGNLFQFQFQSSAKHFCD